MPDDLRRAKHHLLSVTILTQYYPLTTGVIPRRQSRLGGCARVGLDLQPNPHSYVPRMRNPLG
jgi:hypothetical protein